MAGLFNTEIRDYCGEESSIAKLSNHFSKDFAFQQEGLNDINNQTVGNAVPTSFNFNELLKDTIKDNNFKEQIVVKSDGNAVINSDKLLDTNQNVTANTWNFIQPYEPLDNYFPIGNYPIAYNVPIAQFVPPDPSFVAKQWAESELSKFDNKIILESDLKNLSEEKYPMSGQIRFIDVLQNIAADEQQTDMDMLNDKPTAADDKFFYDLDGDLKSMRDKIDSNVDTNEVWGQITKSLQETANRDSTNQTSDSMIFNGKNHYLNDLETIEKSEDIDKNVEDIFQKGIVLYQKGDFSEAILAFEAVVQMKPQFESGWSYLGMSLSENEQDYRAIIACKKCLELNKNNREVLLSLARIYCNEMNLSSTIACLEQWLLANQKYSDLATVGQEAIHSATIGNPLLDDMYEIAFESSGKFAIIDEQLNLALARNEFEIDPELEIAAGTLYHAVQDYERATARFEAAVNVIKDNACLWNKLGTAHCNAGNYEKSINAYRKALELAPGFARAECNIGVAFYNTESYKEAIGHAIKACKIQRVESIDQIKTNHDRIMESDPIWTLIRMSSFKLDRPDLDALIFSRDIEALSKEFGV